MPLPKKNLTAYKKLANFFGKMALEHGALGYRECIGEDLKPKGLPSFTNLLKPGRGEVLITAVIEYKSRKHRDLVMKRCMEDPRTAKMLKNKPLFDQTKMHYSGFETIVQPKG